jgi:hypothetical protein
VCAISRPRGRPCTTDILKTDLTVQSEIDSLRSELTFDSGKKLVLLISFASDEMIRETMKYPEVFFMDCTARVNKQKREFFFSVIRTPSGKCHLSNMTVIPSGKRDCIFFLSFFSDLTSTSELSIFRQIVGLQIHF